MDFEIQGLLLAKQGLHFVQKWAEMGLLRGLLQAAKDAIRYVSGE